MLPLAADRLPPSAPDFDQALRDGLKQIGVSARKVTVDGAAYPSVETFQVDLTGAQFNRDVRIPKPGPAQDAPLFQAKSLEIVARPLSFESLPLTVQISAQDAVFACVPEETVGSILTLRKAADGRVEIEIEKSALEAFLKTLAAQAASKQGANVKEVHLHLDSRGPRSVAFTAEVQAKMFVMSAEVTLSGEASIDDDLNLHVSNLALGGNAMAANLLGKFAKPYFDQVQSKPISLAALSLGDVRLRDVTLQAGETLRLQARFGG